MNKEEIELYGYEIPDGKEYDRIHSWLKKNFGKANKCENPDCNRINIKKYEWANIHEKGYDYNRDNFVMLCKSCHLKYDFPLIKKYKENLRNDYCTKKASPDLTPTRLLIENLEFYLSFNIVENGFNKS